MKLSLDGSIETNVSATSPHRIHEDRDWSAIFAVYARCAQGQHDGRRHYGALGIVAAILLFPCGLLCLVYVLFNSLFCHMLKYRGCVASTQKRPVRDVV